MSPRAMQVCAPEFAVFGGGITTFSRELALALANSGNDLDLWSLSDRDGSWNGASLHGTGNVPRFARRQVFAARLFASAVRRRPDVIVSTHLNFGPVVDWAARATRAASVLVAHGIDVHRGLSRMRQRALRRASAVWAVSRWTRDRLTHIGIPAEKITIVPNTVDDVRFTPGPKPAALIERYGLRSGEQVILTVARLRSSEGYKGYDAVIRALPEVRSVAPVRYLIAGDGDDRERIERLAIDLGLADAVTFCGFVPDDELPDHYRLADVFAMPSTGEGFGIVFLEAMASGICVLGGNRDGTCDALADGELGLLVDPLDARAVRDGLIRLLRREGPPSWFDAASLRQQMLRLYGRVVFRRRVCDALGAIA